jgi:hypothetical protein
MPMAQLHLLPNVNFLSFLKHDKIEMHGGALLVRWTAQVVIYTCHRHMNYNIYTYTYTYTYIYTYIYVYVYIYIL